MQDITTYQWIIVALLAFLVLLQIILGVLQVILRKTYKKNIEVIEENTKLTIEVAKDIAKIYDFYSEQCNTGTVL